MKPVLYLLATLTSATCLKAATVITFDTQPLGPGASFTQGDFQITISEHATNKIFADGNPGNAAGTDNGTFATIDVTSLSDTPFHINSFDYSITVGDVRLRASTKAAPTPTNSIPLFTNIDFDAATPGFVTVSPYSNSQGYTILSFFFDTDQLGSIGDIRIDNISLTSIPEPGSSLLLVLAGVLCLSRRRSA